ncbi:MAG: tripartite tricarboxylate transporter substrate-binding protein [Xanthobacteraceae bacterium]
MMGHRCSVLVGTFALASFFLAGAARAQDWPTRPVTMVVPYAAGGPVDTVGRIMAAGLSEILRQQVVIENVTGAGGMTGTSRVALAAPDGYTFLLGGLAVLGLVPNLYKKPLYNPVTDFASVSLFADSARILIVRKDLPADTLKDFIAYAQTNQAKMQFGSAGAGSGLHICAVLLNTDMGTIITHVPYRGSAPAMQDLMAGRIDFMCEQISTALPQIQAGVVKAIATLGPARSSALPDLPTAQEQGLADLDCSTWSAFVFPKQTPEAIVRRLAQATSEAVDLPLVRERFASVGVTVAAPERRSPEYLAKFLPSELAKWAGPIRASGVSAD